MKKLIAMVLIAGLLGTAGIGCGGGKTEVKSSTSKSGDKTGGGESTKK